MISSPDDRAIGDIGELELIQRIVARLQPSSEELLTGDDAAVVRAAGERLIITTDAIVEGIDFELAYATGYDIGWKALAVNLSDIAAMGGAPRHAVTALCVSRVTPVAIADGIAEGLAGLALQHDVALAGGDVSEAGHIVIAVTALGSLDGDPATRSGARPGDRIFVTGTLGAAAAGLRGLRAGEIDARDRLARRQLRPQPRVREGMELREAGVSAMIDLSDGLAVDLWHLTQASGCGCEVDLAAIPVDPGVTGDDAINLALLGGEDYELLFTAADAPYRAVVQRISELGTPITEIGVVTDGEATVGDRSLEEWRRSGWEHLRTR